MNFSERLNIPPSATLEINALALAKKKAGERVFNLSAGEPMVDTPQVVIDAAVKAMQEGKTHYTPIAGIPELRDAASQWMNRTYESVFSIAETFVTNGGKFACYALCQTLLNPGDEAIIVAPFWVSYSSMIKLAGAEPIVIETSEEDGWKLGIERLNNSITSKTKFLLLNNGSNPTGVLYSRNELKEILELCASKNILVISDEVYSGLTYDGSAYVSCASFPEYRDHVVVVHSASKNFAMTGWRLGLVFGDVELIKKLSTLQGQSTSNTSSITQWASVAAYENAEEIMPPIKEAMLFRRNTFISTFEDLFDAELTSPKSAIYAFLPISAFGVEDTDSVVFCRRVLEEANVAMVPGAAFAAEGYVRCSFGIEEKEIIEALTQLKSYLK